ncbi:hypothetical protein AMECASPLE_012387 [Ameca splendens]|uniref:Uncharacterized protein n=1 Tax=Ameca splendens TaxID=208324 RepID=A0ABV0XPY6_9TELE
MIVQRRMHHQIKNMMENPDDPLRKTAIQQQSVFSQRLLQICCNPDRYRRSFLPTAFSIYNGSLKKPGYFKLQTCLISLLDLMMFLILIHFMLLRRMQNRQLVVMEAEPLPPSLF